MVCQVFFFLVFNCVRSQQHLIWETFPRKKKPFMTSCFLLSIGGGGGACLSLSGTNWTRLISFCSVPSVIDIKPYRDYSMYSSRQMEWTHITLHNTCSGLTNGMQFDTLLAMAAHGIATPQPATLHYVHYVMLCMFVWKSGPLPPVHYVKFGYSEKATKFEKIFHLKFDVSE